MKRNLQLVSVLLLTSVACAQTLVSGTIQDPSFQAFANGTYRISFNGNGRNPSDYTKSGAGFTKLFTGSLDAGGSFAVTLTDNTLVQPSGSQWYFQMCPTATAPCTTVSMSVSGISQDISNAFNAFVPAIQVPVPTYTAFLFAYSDAELVGPTRGSVYFNVTTGKVRDYDGTAWHDIVGAGGGSVTSVGLTVNSTSPSGIFTVTGSPVTTSGILNLNLLGTSGGVPYFSSGSTLSSSGALTANLPVIGGGAGVAPSVGTVTGNTTQFATWTGATTASRCVDTDASGNLHVAAADCNSGGAGSVTSVGLTVNGTSPSGIFTVTGSPVTTTGTLNVNLAGTSGGLPYFSSATVLSSSTAQTTHGVWLAKGAGNAPVSTGAGTIGQVLTSNGAGADPTFQTSTSSVQCAQSSTMTCLFDEFVSGNTDGNVTAQGTNVGSIGFALLNQGNGACKVNLYDGTTTPLNHPGVILLSNLVGGPGDCYLALGNGNTSGTLLNPQTETFKIYALVANHGATGGGTEGYIRFGLITDRGVQDDTRYVWFQANNLGSNAHWFCAQADGGASSSADSGVASGSSTGNQFHLLEIDASATAAVIFKIDNTPVCGSVTTNLLSGYASVGFEAQPNANGAGGINIDYFRADITVSR